MIDSRKRTGARRNCSYLRPSIKQAGVGLVALLTLISVLFYGCDKPQAGKEKSASQSKESDEKKPDGAKKGEKGEKEGRGEKGRVKLSDQELQNGGVKSEEVKLRVVAGTVVLTATIHANQDRLVHLAPRVPAKMVKVSANLGDKVKAGQTLALLDSIELGEAHSAYQQARSQFDLTNSELQRAQKLKAEDIIPDKEFFRTRSEYEKAKATLRAAEDKLRLLGGTHLESETRATSVFPITTPFSGTVIEKKAVLGELAQPDKSIFTVADLSTLWIEANLFESDLRKVRVGAPASVTVTAYPGESFRGKVTYISSMVDKDSRAVQARIEVANADGRLKPEMFASASINSGVGGEQLLIPESAVLLVSGMPTVFVDDDGEYDPRPVELGDKSGGQVAVKAGIKPGEWVVSSGAFAIKARMLKSQIGDSD